MAATVWGTDLLQHHEQEIISGWGGAFTDAAGINVAQLSQPAQDAIVK